MNKQNITVREEEERIKPDLTRRGFEFFKYLDLPAGMHAADVHLHDAIEFVYLTEGSVTVNIDGREDRLYPGDLVLFRSRGVHSMRTENCPLNRYYTLKLRPKLLYNISPKDSRGKVALRFSVFNSELKYIWRKNELEGTDILKGYRELMEKNPEMAVTLAVKGMLPKNTIGAKSLTRLKVYAGSEHNNAAQQPIVLD